MASSGIGGVLVTRGLFAGLVLSLIAVSAGRAAVRAQQRPDKNSVRDGVYTEEQAKRGEAIYTDQCVNCDGPALEGRDMAAPLTVVGEWRAYNGDYASTRYSPLDQINKDTVKNLKVVWRQSLTPDAVKEGRDGVPPPPTNNETTPLMVGGLAYFSTGIGGVVAVDARLVPLA